MIIDLSHEIVAQMVTYPGLAGPEMSVVISRSQSARRLGSGVSFEIGSMTLVGNTGTYLDAPYHYHVDQADIAGVPLERIVDVPIAVVRVLGTSEVRAADLPPPDRLSGHAVLVHTGWSQHWGTPRYLDLDCPHLTADAVDALIGADVALVGIDSLNIDSPYDVARPAHQGLLGAGIPILEHLTNLDAVPDNDVVRDDKAVPVDDALRDDNAVPGRARLTALPAPVRGMASFPVRAVAVIGT